MKKYRIKVDLSTFFTDERKLAYVLVDPSWDNVGCLQQRVEEIFQLQKLRFVTAEGCFVPPQEAIQVIRSDDVLKALQPSEKLIKKKKIHKTVEIPNPRNNENLCEGNIKNALSCSTPNQAKRPKNVKGFGRKNNAVNEISSTSEKPDLMKQEPQPQPFPIKDSANLDGQNSDSSSPLIANTRKRKRKKKNYVESMQEESQVQSMEGDDGEVLAKKAFIDNSKPAKKKQSQCVVVDSGFNETIDKIRSIDSKSENTMPQETKFCCSLFEIPLNEPRIFPITEKLNKNKEIPNKNSNYIIDKARSPIVIENILVLSDKMENTFQTEKGDIADYKGETVNVSTATNRSSERAGNCTKIAPNCSTTVANCSAATDASFSATVASCSAETVANCSGANVSCSGKKVAHYSSKTFADDYSVIAIESECDDDDTQRVEQMDHNISDSISEVIDVNESDEDSNG